MLKLKGKVAISQISGGDSDKCIRIEIEDTDSSCIVLRGTMSRLAFANILTGFGHQDIDIEFNDSGFVGSQSENKEELVPVPRFGQRPDGWQKKALESFEVNGWKARDGDIDNHHRSAYSNGFGLNYQNVVFFRHVNKKTGEPIV